MSIWADYSFARPPLADLKRSGVVGLFRYLAPLPNKKVIDTAEKDAILADGFDLALNWEWYEGRCNEGAAAGRADATEAVRQAKALGYPSGSCIYFSHDTSANNWPAIEAYFTSARAVIHAAGYTIGAYGSFYLIQFLHSKGLIDYGWQTKAWSSVLKDGKWVVQRDPWAVVYQDGTALVAGTDNDITSSADIGSWLGGNMPLTDDDKKWIVGQFTALFEEIKADLDGTKKRVAAIAPVVDDLDTRTASLQAAVATLPGGSNDARAVVDEMGRRLTAGA